ncbi:MAG: cation transporter [Propionibacteriales bacterium]|nr:cation transporter [Propionibacteriales bacterium]
MVGHRHDTRHDNRARLILVLGVTAAAMIAEVVGAVLSGSLALVADAAHMFTDAAGITIALTAMAIAERRTAARSTFGLYRLEIFAAALNSVLLLALAGWIGWEAVDRLVDPPPVAGTTMLVVAVVGLAANAYALRVLAPAASTNLNVRGAYLEVLGDLLGSAAVVTAAVVVRTTGATIADPLCSIIVSVFIVPRTWMLLREAVNVLLEATPRGFDLDHLRAHVLGIDGVVGVHDLHVWTISSELPVMSAHVVVDDDSLSHAGEVLDALQDCLGAHFDVSHSTFQIEPMGHVDHETRLHP